jgi:hypothetical protein
MDDNKPVESITDRRESGQNQRRKTKGANMRSEKKSTMKRRLTSGLAMAGVSVVAGLGLTAGWAQAEPTETDAEIMAGGCANNYVCGWEDKNYGGDKWVNWKVGAVGTVYEVDGWDGDDEISSISNESGKLLRLYAGDNATGYSICFAKETDAKDLSDLGGGQSFNDEIESIKVVSSC